MFTIIYDTTELHQAEYNPLHNVDSSFLFLLVHGNANDILNPKTKVLDLTRLTYKSQLNWFIIGAKHISAFPNEC